MMRFGRLFHPVEALPGGPVSVVGGLLEPDEPLLAVKLDPAAGQVTVSQTVFGLGEAPVGGFPNPLDPLGGILGDAESDEASPGKGLASSPLTFRRYPGRYPDRPRRIP